MIKKTSLLISVLILTLPFAAAAQRHGGPGSGADPADAFEIYGTVLSFSAARGAGMPALRVDDPALGVVEVGLGPAWYLRAAGFAAAPGDEIDALAYPCSTCFVPAVAAWVNNLTTGVTVELRDDDGLPLWRQSGAGPGGDPRCQPASGDPKSGPGNMGGNHHGGAGSGGSGNGSTGNGQGNGGTGNGQGNGGNGNGEPGSGGPGAFGGQCSWTAPDLSAVATVTGTVVSVDAEPGAGMPAMVLATDAGELELLLSPYHAIAAAGFLIAPGMELIVTYAPWMVAGDELLATISITDPVTGLTIQLRDPETGYPLRGGYGNGGS